MLQLVMKGEIDLWSFSIADIAKAFLKMLTEQDDNEPTVNLEEATEFLVIAATLVELKTRRLLPQSTDLDLDDEFDGIYDRDLLLARLVESHTFRTAGERLQAMIIEAAQSHPREVGVLEDRFKELRPDALADVTSQDLRNAFRGISKPVPDPIVDISHINQITITVEDAVNELVNELTKLKKASFRRLTSGLTDRIEVVVRFLGVLELIKQGLADVRQSAIFAEIVIVWIGGKKRPEPIEPEMASITRNGQY